MRFYKAIISLVPCLSLAIAGQAQTTNILDWQFSTGDNPAMPTAATTINPDGGNPLATITGSSYNYSFFDRGPQAGPPMGTWEIDVGQLQLTMDRSAVGLVSYTLQVFQFADSGRQFLSGDLAFSLGPQLPFAKSYDSFTESVYVPQSGDMTGSWYQDTYNWSAVNLNPSIYLGIQGASGPILVDEVKLTIVGNLVPVPEPSCGLITAAGLLAFGIRSWLRRKA